MTGSADVQAITAGAAGPVPWRVSLASEQFSGLIDFLLPRARTDYCDLDIAALARYLDVYHATDTAADAWVTYLRDHRGAGQEQLEQALESGIGSVASPPPELTALLRSVDHLPAAIDLARVEEGARCLRRIGAITITGFGIAAGFYLGAILPGSARALAASARTVQHTTPRPPPPPPPRPRKVRPGHVRPGRLRRVRRRLQERAPAALAPRRHPRPPAPARRLGHQHLRRTAVAGRHPHGITDLQRHPGAGRR